MEKGKVIAHYEFLRLFRKSKRVPVYMITGNDSYWVDKVRKELSKRFVQDSSSDFDYLTFYGDSTTGAEILEQLEMLPFLSKYKVVQVRNFDKLKVNDKNLLAEYSANPLESSILILTIAKPDNRQKAIKTLNKHSVVINCKQPYGAYDISRWLSAELRETKTIMNSAAINLFAESIDPDYMVASNELEKLRLLTKDSGRISIEDVEASVGRSKTNNVFELQNSLGAKNLKRSMQIVENMLDNNEPGVYILVMLNRFFISLWKINALRHRNLSDAEIMNRHMFDIFQSKRDSYLKFSANYNKHRLTKVFSLLLQADIDLKSLNVKEEILIEILIHKICRV